MINVSFFFDRKELKYVILFDEYLKSEKLLTVSLAM